MPPSAVITHGYRECGRMSGDAPPDGPTGVHPPDRCPVGRMSGSPVGAAYLTLPAVSPPTRRFSMSMNRMTTGRIATIETPNTYCQLVSY